MPKKADKIIKENPFDLVYFIITCGIFSAASLVLSPRRLHRNSMSQKANTSFEKA